MDQRINIAELLMQCPLGMELDCIMYDDITLLGVDDMKFTIFPIRVLRKDGVSVELTKYGQYVDADYAKCIIFPKGKTTWEGFVPPYKFKVGDKIKRKETDYTYIVTIAKLDDDYYDYVNEDGQCGVIYISTQNDWELVPDKFAITTLKPFDKVLVRDNNTQKWTADLFSFYDKSLVYPYSCVGHYTNQCIPYEGNEHLLGTTNDCIEYYKNW